MKDNFTIHAFFPNYYDETRVSYSLMSIMDAMRSPSIETDSYVSLKAKHVASKYVKPLMPNFLFKYLIRLIGGDSTENICRKLYQRRRSAIKAGDVAYFWLSNPADICNELRNRGVMVVREMINCTLETRRAELKKAYKHMGGLDYTEISDDDIHMEREQLLSADMVFCPNQFVMESVIAYGVPVSKCCKTSYGWDPQRFNAYPKTLLHKAEGLNVLFVGTVEVRKGAPCLLEMWERADIKGQLLLAGKIEDQVREKYMHVLSRPDVIKLGYVEDMEIVYRSADLFCFLSWEEGGPMVTIEAIGCGLPCVVTPMGSSGVITDNGNGLIVEAGDIDAAVKAIQRLSNDRGLLQKFASQAREDAKQYTWKNVGIARRQAIENMRKQTLTQ